MGKNLDISDSVKLASVLCSQTIMQGGTWGFLQKNHIDYANIKEGLLKDGGKFVNVVEVENGIVVRMQLDSLIYVMQSTKVCNQEDIEYIKNISSRFNSKEECTKVIKFLESIVEGTTKQGRLNKTGYTEYRIACLCTNKSNKLQINGCEYAGFDVDIMTMLGYLKKLGTKCIAYVYTDMGFVDLKTITVGDIDKVYRGSEIADTHNGLFVTIRVKRK